MTMATEAKVKQYLAFWFQLGKKVFLRNGQEGLLPEPVIEGDRYSSEFEGCWQRILSPESGDCYLEGTEQTIQQLLTSAWEITDCARCNMPVPTLAVGVQSLLCPCSDLPNWPNLELPPPRSPIDARQQLQAIRERLLNHH
jgi:hypothetical protein